MSAQGQDKQQSFDTIVDRLEAIAKQLEDGDTKLEEALSLFEEGVRLAKQGNVKLDSAERKIEVLLQGDEVGEFDADGSNDSD